MTARLVSQAFGEYLEFWIPPRKKKKGIALVEAIPIQDGPHFIVKHIEGDVSQSSHAVDVHMGESLSRDC
jgi:hypothetical protein